MPQPGAKRRRKAPLLPLDYMLAVINDPSADIDRRDRMAICAAQYCHPRAANHPETKKSLAARAAETAGAGTDWAEDLDFVRQ
jgi:hypothetical protein